MLIGIEEYNVLTHHCKNRPGERFRQRFQMLSIGIIHGIFFIKSGAKSQGRINCKSSIKIKTCNTDRSSSCHKSSCDSDYQYHLNNKHNFVLTGYWVKCTE